MNSKRLLSKAQLGLTAIASKDETRYNLNRIHVTEKYTEATDGKCLVRVEKATMPADEYPVQGIPGHEFAGDIDIQIPIDSLKNLKPAKSKLPILEYACVSTNDKESYVTTTDLQSVNSVTIPGSVQDDKYADTDQVIPKFEPDAIKFGIDAKLLTRIVDFATKYGSKTFVGMLWTIPKDYDGQGPIQIEFKTDGSEQNVKAIIMPCRI
jgi:hypothetical protein